MNGEQFETDRYEFECLICGNNIKVNPAFLSDDADNPEEQTINVTCSKCGTEYLVGKKEFGDGLIVTMVEGSEPELVEEEERNLEEE